MEQLEGVPQEGRYHAKGNYDRRFILKVIQEIEEGLPLQAACSSKKEVGTAPLIEQIPASFLR